MKSFRCYEPQTDYAVQLRAETHKDAAEECCRHSDNMRIDMSGKHRIYPRRVDVSEVTGRSVAVPVGFTVTSDRVARRISVAEELRELGVSEPTEDEAYLRREEGRTRRWLRQTDR